MSAEPSDSGSVGPYRLVQRLGEGGMGVVHLGLDGEGRAVAVKVLRAHVAADPDARRRLGREVETLRRVRHPRVAEVIDADVEGAVPYLVTRFVPGKPLDAHVKEHGPLARGHIARVGSVLADALKAIHAAGIVHRDVKPANVMLLDGEPVLIDFGIAHVADETRITHTGLVMGTPGYLSPEVIGGGAVSEATDWWGWGATLAFAATGRPPFGGGPIEVVLDRVRRGQCDLDGVEGALRHTLTAALITDPGRRPPPDELLAGLAAPAPKRGASRSATTDPLEAATTRVPPPGDEPTARTPPPGEAATARTPAPNEHVTARVPPPWPQPPLSPPAAAAAPTDVHALPATRRFDPPAARANGVPANGAPANGSPAYGTPGPAYGSPPVATRPPDNRPPPPPPPPQGVAGRPAPPPPGDASFREPPKDPRTDEVRGLLLGLLVTLAAVGVVAPYGAFWLTAWAMIAARVVDTSSIALMMRRHQHGRRGTDAVATAAAMPWRVVVACVVTFFSVLLPLAVGVSVAFIVGTAQAGAGASPTPTEPVPLACGMVALVLTAWFGPGGSTVRRGTRTSLRGIVRGTRSRIAYWAVLGLLLLSVALMLSSGATPDWGPIEGSRLMNQLNR